MRTSLFRLLPFAAMAALFICAPQARAQSAYGYSSLAIYGTTVSSESETDLDYYAESYYGVETDAYLWANSSIVASGSSTSEGETVGLSVSVSVNTSYEIQTNHWVTTYDATPYCFSCVASGEWFAGSMTVNANSYYDEEDDGSVYLGTTYDTGNTDGSAPSISGVDYTTYGNEERGTTGYVILYGSNFTTPYGSTSVSMPYPSSPDVTYLSDGQINLSYTIPTDTASGTLTNNIGVSTPYGSDYANFYVYDPAPYISSISPSTWYAGSSTAITISGSGFGSAPSVSFSDSYVSFAPSSAGDTSITGTLTVGSGDPGGSVTLTVGADAWGGLSFQGGAGAGSGTVTGSGSVTPLPTITGVSASWVAGSTTSDVVVSGTNFPGSCPSAGVSGSGAGASPQFLVSAAYCSTTSVQGTAILNDTHAPGPTATLTFTWGSASATYSVTIVPIKMKLQTAVATSIDVANNYSEDTTISVTAVRGDTGATLTDFTGSVSVSEDTGISGYVQVYSQNGGTLGTTSGAVTISTAGTVNFVAKSLAGPKSVSTAANAAMLLTTNYPVYGGTDLSVSQWIISGTRIDTHSSGSVYDWLQYRTRDIFSSNSTGDVGTVLGSISFYTMGYVAGEGGHTNLTSAAQSSIQINPYLTAQRLDSSGGSVCGNTRGAYLTNTMIHEGRHAYQGTEAALSGNDADGDFLVKSVAIAPTTIILDTTASRTVCNAAADTTESLAYHGDGTFDSYEAPDYGDYAREEDAYVFAAN